MRGWIDRLGLAGLAGLAGVLTSCSSPAAGNPAPGPPVEHVPSSPSKAPPPSPAPARKAAPAPEIITAAIQDMNSDRYSRPASQFRPGHVSRIKAPAATRTPTGFQVQFA